MFQSTSWPYRIWWVLDWETKRVTNSKEQQSWTSYYVDDWLLNGANVKVTPDNLARW